MPNKARKPNVVQLCFSRAKGGLEMSTIKWARRFADHGFSSTLICHSGSFMATEVASTSATDKNEAVTSAQQKSIVATKCFSPHDYFSPLTTLRLYHYLREAQPDAVFVHSLRDLWLVTPALKMLPEVRLLGFARMFLRNINKKDFFHSWIYSRLDRLIALSNPQAKELMNCLPVATEKYTVIPNGVDTKKFSPLPENASLRRELGWPEDHLIVGMVGRLDPQKGCGEIVAAAADLLGQWPKMSFVLVGEETPDQFGYAEQLREGVRKNGLEGRFFITGFRQDIPELMGLIDIFLMPSYEENFANVLLEAMACQKAIVATGSGGTVDMITHGQEGLLIQPQSSPALRDAITTLASDANLRERLARQARTRACREFDQEVVFQKVAALLN